MAETAASIPSSRQFTWVTSKCANRTGAHPTRKLTDSASTCTVTRMLGIDGTFTDRRSKANGVKNAVVHINVNRLTPLHTFFYLFLLKPLRQ